MAKSKKYKLELDKDDGAILIRGSGDIECIMPHRDSDEGEATDTELMLAIIAHALSDDEIHKYITDKYLEHANLKPEIIDPPQNDKQKPPNNLN